MIRLMVVGIKLNFCNLLNRGFIQRSDFEKIGDPVRIQFSEQKHILLILILYLSKDKELVSKRCSLSLVRKERS